MKLDIENFERYTQNLFKNGNIIYSYKTAVAEIKDGKLYKLDWHVPGVGSTSPTTSKHINYVAKELNLEIV
tara:strand:+ start:357 stop:569 length:213 start_codon:yes stop_codon:yes gene_type:complete